MKTFRALPALLFALLLALSATAQVPVLNSYPASRNVIFLDFDGHLVSGTVWNGNGAIACNPSGLTADQITTVFNRVAEDYRPFTVNVTTDSTKYWAAPATNRMRVVLTTSSSWYGSAGGVSYINSFTWGDNTPCFVFTALLNFNVKNIAEAAAHEAGHTLGLRHQAAYDANCNLTAEYNPGKGSGEIGWAPIMGVGYYQNMTLWNHGANPYGCNYIQDDLSVITGNDNGISFRPDDYGNTIGTATTATLVNNSFSLSGVIEQPADVDAMKFATTTGGRFQLDATPFAAGAGNAGSDIDLEVELLNGSGQVIGVYNAATALNASVDTTLTAGTYYLRVQGKGNSFAPDYASLGAYSLSASITPVGALPVHKLQLMAATDGRQHKLAWEIVADEKVVSQKLDVATDGIGFKTLSAAPADARGYTYTPSAEGVYYYRLSVLLDNGKQAYSNTIALRSGNAGSRPSLVGNLSTGTLTVSAPSPYNYSVVDMGGRTVAKGKLAQGLTVLSPSFPGSGIYLITFENGAERYTEKFSKL